MMLNSFKEAARPFSIYISSLAVCIGVFVPWATSEKLLIAAGIAGSVSWMRSKDLRTSAEAQ